MSSQRHQLQQSRCHAVELTDGSSSSTDPPYYDNVGYADLSDFFYVWLRRSLSDIYPELLGTMLTPKADELVADPFRHGGKDKPSKFFEDGFTEVFRRICEGTPDGYPDHRLLCLQAGRD